MAQLVERLVRNEEASGSNPLISTNEKAPLSGCFLLYRIGTRTRKRVRKTVGFL